MEARYVEAGSMNLFRTQNRALKPTSLARIPIRAWWDPNAGQSSGTLQLPKRASCGLD